MRIFSSLLKLVELPFYKFMINKQYTTREGVETCRFLEDVPSYDDDCDHTLLARSFWTRKEFAKSAFLCAEPIGPHVKWRIWTIYEVRIRRCMTYGEETLKYVCDKSEETRQHKIRMLMLVPSDYTADTLMQTSGTDLIFSVLEIQYEKYHIGFGVWSINQNRPR